MKAPGKIAVAGAAGRVGRHVVYVLEEQGYDVVAISRSAGVDVVTGQGLADACAASSPSSTRPAAPPPSSRRRRAIGERTRAALAVRRREGVRLGRPPSIPPEIHERIVLEREDGQTLRAIAAQLNDDGVQTARGGSRWHPETVRKVVRQARVTVEAARAL